MFDLNRVFTMNDEIKATYATHARNQLQLTVATYDGAEPDRPQVVTQPRSLTIKNAPR